MYFVLTNQLGMVLPSKDYCTKRFMYGCIVGIKRYMTKQEDLNGLLFKEHKPGFQIKENSIKYWCSYLKHFPNWEHYVPHPYIEKMEKQAQIEDVQKR